MLRRSFRMARASFDVMKSTPSLVVPPLVAMAASLLLVLTASGTIFFRSRGGSIAEPDAYSVIDYVAFSLILLVTSTVTLLCNAAVVAAADARLRGEPATVGYGFGVALSRFPQILGWGVITVVVGSILRAIQERAGILGSIISWVGSVTWGVITYFALPVLVIERVGPIAAIKRSAKIVRSRWGEVVAFEVGIGLVSFLFLVPVMAAAVALGLLVHPAVGIVTGAIAFVLLMAVSTALTAIYQTALYQYAVWGHVPPPYAESDFLDIARYTRRGFFGSTAVTSGTARPVSRLIDPTQGSEMLPRSEERDVTGDRYGPTADYGEPPTATDYAPPRPNPAHEKPQESG